MMMAVVCVIVYTLCGMRPVDLRFFAYVYNVYNRKADVFLLLCRLATLVSRSLARSHILMIFLPTNMCTLRSISRPPFHLAERELYCGKARADRELAQHCEYYMLVLSLPAFAAFICRSI